MGLEGLSLNQNGLLFTAMSLLIIVALISLNSSLKQVSRESQDISGMAAVLSVGNKMDNIERVIVDLDTETGIRGINERFLPFSYGLNKDMNSLRIGHRLPLKDITLQGFLDVINMLEVFLEDRSRDNVFDGLAVDINTLADTPSENLAVHFLTEPFCYEYALQGYNTVLVRKSDSSKCYGSFLGRPIKKFDLNVLIFGTGQDFNRVFCDGGNCPQEAYNPNHPENWPYYRVEVLEENCHNCVLEQTVASAHFNPLNDFSLTVECAGSNCASAPITLKQSGLDFNVFYQSDYRVEISTEITFNQRIREFYFLDFNAGVSNFKGDAFKSQ